MEVLPTEQFLYDKFHEAKENLQKWIDTHVLPSRYGYLETERQRKENEEYNKLMITFRKAEKALLEHQEINFGIKEINKLEEILLLPKPPKQNH